MFQSYAFQSYAFQGVVSGAFVPTDSLGGAQYIYTPSHQIREIHQKNQIIKKKTELQKIESVISEYERQKALADESLKIAKRSEHNRLLKKQNELIAEITRLLTVKAEMVARIRRDEEMLMLMIAMRRRRFRAF